MITCAVISLKGRLIEAVNRVSFLFLTYLESPKQTVHRVTNDER